jgi:hypothetical protein
MPARKSTRKVHKAKKRVPVEQRHERSYKPFTRAQAKAYLLKTDPGYSEAEIERFLDRMRGKGR